MNYERGALNEVIQSLPPFIKVPESVVLKKSSEVSFLVWRVFF